MMATLTTSSALLSVLLLGAVTLSRIMTASALAVSPAYVGYEAPALNSDALTAASGYHSTVVGQARVLSQTSDKTLDFYDHTSGHFVFLNNLTFTSSSKVVGAAMGTNVGVVWDQANQVTTFAYNSTAEQWGLSAWAMDELPVEVLTIMDLVLLNDDTLVLSAQVEDTEGAYARTGLADSSSPNYNITGIIYMFSHVVQFGAEGSGHLWALTEILRQPSMEASYGFGYQLAFDDYSELLFACDLSSSERGLRVFSANGTDLNQWTPRDDLLMDAPMTAAYVDSSACSIDAAGGMVAFLSPELDFLSIFHFQQYEEGLNNFTVPEFEQSTLGHFSALSLSTYAGAQVLLDGGNQDRFLVSDPAASQVHVITRGGDGLSSWREGLVFNTPEGASGFGTRMAGPRVGDESSTAPWPIFMTTLTGRGYAFAIPQFDGSGVTLSPTQAPVGAPTTAIGPDGDGTPIGGDDYATIPDNYDTNAVPTAAPTTPNPTVMLQYIKEADLTNALIAAMVIGTLCFIVLASFYLVTMIKRMRFESEHQSLFYDYDDEMAMYYDDESDDDQEAPAPLPMAIAMAASRTAKKVARHAHVTAKRTFIGKMPKDPLAVARARDGPITKMSYEQARAGRGFKSNRLARDGV